MILGQSGHTHFIILAFSLTDVTLRAGLADVTLTAGLADAKTN